MGSWLKLVASQKNLPRSLILVELRLKGGIPMISELGIAPGPAGEFAAPHLEEGSTDRQRERCGFLRQGRGTGIRFLLRSCSEIEFPPSLLPSPKQ